MGKKLIAFVGAVFVTSAFAVAEAQDGKFAFFNLMKLQEKSVKAKEYGKKFQDSYEVKKASLERKQKAYVDLKDSVQRSGSMLNESARNDKIKELTNMEIDLKIEEQKAKESLEHERQEMMQLVQADISKIVKKIREERGFSFVFDAQSLMSANEALDITDEVIKAFDAGAAPAATAKPKPAATAPVKPKPPAAR